MAPGLTILGILALAAAAFLILRRGSGGPRFSVRLDQPPT